MYRTFRHTDPEGSYCVAVKRALLLLGSVALSYNLSTLVHELGHVFAALLTDGSVEAIVIHPFSWSYSFSYSENELLHSAGGVLLGSLFGIVIFFGLRRCSKAGLLHLLLLGPFPLIENGEYLIVDTLMQSGGDAISLAALGVPRFIILVAGLILLIAGLIMAYSIARRTGLLAGKLPLRLLSLAGGILPYLFAMVAYAWLYKPTEIAMWFAYFVSGCIFVLVLTLAPEIPLMVFTKLKQDSSKRLNFRTVVAVDLMGLSVVVFLLIGPLPKYPTYGKSYNTRPEDFPQILTPFPGAEGLDYHVDGSQSSYLLTYMIKKMNYRHEELWDFLTDIHNHNGYVRLAYDLADPNITSPDNLNFEPSQNKGETLHNKICRQYWLKVKEEDLSLASLRVTWLQDCNEILVGHHLDLKYPAEGLTRYLTLHPEEIEPNQIKPLLTGPNRKK